MTPNKRTFLFPKFLFGLTLIRDQWRRATVAFLASIVTLALDFALTTGVPKIISGLEVVLVDGDYRSVSAETVLLSLLIIIRPMVGWTINFFQINIILTILRNLEEKVRSEAAQVSGEGGDYSADHFANMLISHGRYYVDNYLIPLIRAVTDVGSIIVISIGLAIQFPIPLALFVGVISGVLVIYQSSIRKILVRNGEALVISYERIITLAKSAFGGRINGITIDDVLDVKKKSSLTLASISQGLKYVIEFGFMVSFGIASIYVVLISPDIFVVFVSTFAYAGVRLLPLFTSVLAFSQGKDSATHPINELSELINKNDSSRFVTK